MNSNRRAELQRKLSMSVVPRPPAGLADRIKADIPKYLQEEPARKRFPGAYAFTLRLAASALLVITTAVVTVNLMTPAAEQQLAATSTAAAPNVAPSAKMAQAAKDERKRNHQAPAIQIAQTEPDAQPTIGRMAPPSAGRTELPREVARLAEERQSEAEADTGFAFEAQQETAVVASGVVGGERARDAAAKSAERRDFAVVAPAAPPARADTITITAEAPMIDAAPRPAPAAPQSGASRSLVQEAYAADLALGPKADVFGISVDPAVFQRIKTTIESGHRPAADAVDIEALVNYFAGAPEKAPRRGLRLEVEASPALVDTDGEHAVLRFTVDTPVRKLAPRASAPPVASNVRLTVDVNRDVVASLQRIGDSDAIAPESVLSCNLSVTGLYRLELEKGLRSTARVATVRLEYTSVEDGKQHSLEKVIHGHDLAKSWSRASRRHRLASLGALWGESLKGSTTGVDVARRAGELATQDPKDERARELANAASVTPGER